MKKHFFILFVIILVSQLIIAQDTLTKKQTRDLKKSYLLSDRHWSVDLPLWVPGFRGDFSYGDINLEGEDGEEIENPIAPPDRPTLRDLFHRLFRTDWYLKFYYLTRIAYENKRFSGEFDAMYGSAGSSTQFRYNRKEIVQATFRTINMRLTGGYKVYTVSGKNGKFRYDLYGYLGARIYLQGVFSDLNPFINKLDINPTWAEPVLGIQNRLIWKRWLIVVQADYGGFFIPEKQSVQLNANVSYRTGRPTSFRIGWNHLDLYHEGSFKGEDLKLGITLSGPSLTFELHF